MVDPVQKVLDDFNFTHVWNVMRVAGLQWFAHGKGFYLPSEDQLRKTAAALLQDAYASKGTVVSRYETGGFRAEFIGGVLSLLFKIETASFDLCSIKDEDIA